MTTGWLKNAVIHTNKPKYSLISLLKKRFGGPREGRDRSVLHASDVTKPDFCPRKWAFLDLMKVENSKKEYVSTAMDLTYTMGWMTEKLLVEDWLGDNAVGNWQCRRCNSKVSMCSKPKNGCLHSKDCQWEYKQFVVSATEFGLVGGIDCLFEVGTPLWLVTEVKTLNPTDFDTILIPQPEHRLRTNLYLKLLSSESNPYRNKINLLEACVLYVSRGYGKMNAVWNEILPFKEFVVIRDDSLIKPVLQKAKALKIFREEMKMPSGICATAIDKHAQKCTVCKECFSGQFPATVKWENIEV